MTLSGRARIPGVLLALAAAAAVAAACGGSAGGGTEPADFDAAAVSGALSSIADSDPADPSEADAADNPGSRPDPVESRTDQADEGVADSGAVADSPSDPGQSDAVAGEGDPATPGNGSNNESGSESGNGSDNESGNGPDDNPATGNTNGGTVDNGGSVDAPEPEPAEPEPGPEPTEPEPEPEPTQPVPVPEPPDDGPMAPLTGELTSDPALAQRRVLAVKVGNGDRRVRPQAGLAAADIVYDMLVEAGKTRLMAVFHSETPSRIGPVRSARSSDIDLLADLSTPYLASSGANAGVLGQVRRAERAGTLFDVGAHRRAAPYSRDRSRSSPFNLYFYSEHIVGEDAEPPPEPLDEPVVPLFDYGSNESGGVADAVGVTVTYNRVPGNVVSHIWDAAVGGWVRIQEGDLMVTETDFGSTEVAPVNVVVAWVPYRVSTADPRSPQAVSYGTGEALVLTAGAVFEGSWERTEERPGFRFFDTAGGPLSLSPGPTWVLLANSSRRFPVTRAEIVTTADGARMLADARAAARAAGNEADAA